MTAWQDQPPQSRRQLRLNERSGAHDDGAQNDFPQAGQSDAVATPESQPEVFPHAGWDAASRRSSNVPEEHSPEEYSPAAHSPVAQHRSRAEAAVANGRRSQPGFPYSIPTAPEHESHQADRPRGHRGEAKAEDQGAAQPFAEPRQGTTSSVGEPLEYFTQLRSQVPAYGGPSFGVSAVAPPTPSAATPQTEAASSDAAQSSQPYRIRDFSPESRRSAFSSTSEATTAEWNQPDAPGNLDYYTQQGTGQHPVIGQPSSTREPLSEPSSDSRPGAQASATSSLADLRAAGQDSRQPHPEHTLTRRQLRALRESSEPLDDEEPAGPVAALPQSDEPVVPAAAVAQPWPLAPVRSDEQSESPVPVQEQQEPQQPQAAVQVPPPLQAPAAPAPQSSYELSDAMAEFDALMARDSVEVVTDAGTDNVEPPHTAPTGHWSTQGELDGDAQLDGITLSRNIGATSGAVTANHLVISSVPTANDLFRPFSPTGEIMVTGTIDLPRSLGSTGAHPARYDHSDVDALLEAGDREDSNVDSAPVRAIRAVSTHTSSRGLIGTGKPPRSSRLPMVLAVSTAAVAAVVVALFVTGMVLHLF